MVPALEDAEAERGTDSDDFPDSLSLDGVETNGVEGGEEEDEEEEEEDPFEGAEVKTETESLLPFLRFFFDLPSGSSPTSLSIDVDFRENKEGEERDMGEGGEPEEEEDEGEERSRNWRLSP